MSRFVKIAKRVLLVIGLIWSVLGVNAWQYFSNAGPPGVYFSMRYAVAVLNLPDAEAPEDLAGHKVMSADELESLINRNPTLVFKYPAPDEEWGFVHEIKAQNWLTNSARSGSSFVITGRHFLIDGNRFCTLPNLGGKTYCRHFFVDSSGGLAWFSSGVVNVGFKKLTVR